MTRPGIQYLCNMHLKKFPIGDSWVSPGFSFCLISEPCYSPLDQMVQAWKRWRTDRWTDATKCISLPASLSYAVDKISKNTSSSPSPDMDLHIVPHTHGVRAWTFYFRPNAAQISRLCTESQSVNLCCVEFLYQSVLIKRMYWVLFVDNFIVLSKGNPVGWRLQPTRGPRAFGSPPPMSSHHVTI